MVVYMIQAGDECGPVKIGYGDPVARLNDCQIGNHLKLRLLRMFNGGAAEELTLHVRFEDLWIRGEWHNFSRSMLGDVGLFEILPPIVEQSVPGTISILLTPQKVEVQAKAVGLTISEVCKRADIANSTFSRWKAGKTWPTLSVYQRIEAVLESAERAVP